jgi:uncharacterized protein
MSLYYNKTARSTVRRRGGRAHYDRLTVDAILAEGFVGHIGVQADGQPFVIPVLYAPVPERDLIYVHGSPVSRLVGTLAEGVPMCLTVTLVDGLVLARSAFHHSVNYRSVVVLGDGRAAEDAAEKRRALEVIVEHVAPGRSADARRPSEQELAATEVVALSIREASAKVRTGPPVDAAEDYALPVWAGELPLGLRAADPVPDPRCSAPIPEYLNHYRGVHV